MYQETNFENFYNLTLADLQIDGTIDINTVSNNGDMVTILATVFQSLLVFFDEYPRSRVVFSGSSQSRTRLYQIALSKELHFFEDAFLIYGFKDDKIELFRRNQSYEGFVITLKTNKLSI